MWWPHMRLCNRCKFQRHPATEQVCVHPFTLSSRCLLRGSRQKTGRQDGKLKEIPSWGVWKPPMSSKQPFSREKNRAREWRETRHRYSSAQLVKSQTSNYQDSVGELREPLFHSGPLWREGQLKEISKCRRRLGRKTSKTPPQPNNLAAWL